MALFHRVESTTQTPETAALQIESLEIWGREPRGSAFLTVQAIPGPLPARQSGVEFTTDIPPDPGGCPDEVRWRYRGPESQVTRITRDDGVDFAVLKVATVTWITRSGNPSGEDWP